MPCPNERRPIHRGKRRILAPLLALGAALGLGASIGPSSAAETAPPDLQRDVQRLVTLGAPGAAILLQGPGVNAFATAGTAAHGTSRPIRRTDVWRIASVSKMVTAVVVMQLVEERRLRLSDEVGSHVAGLPKHVARIPITRLLNHTSGLAEYLTVGDEVPTARAITTMLARGISRDRLVSRAMAKKPARTVEHDYANTNYVVLERVITAVERRPFTDVVRDRVMAPLALAASGFPDAKGRLPLPHVRAHLPGDGPDGPMTDYAAFTDVTEHIYALGGDGGLFASADDVSTLLASWSDGRLLGAGTRNRMLERPAADHDGRHSYGLGIMIVDLPCGRRVLGHEGRDIGMMTSAFMDAATGIRLVLMINTVPDGNPELEQALSDVPSRVFCGGPATTVTSRSG